MAFALTGCEDVPQPYETPSASTDSTTVEPSGSGTVDDPYNVAMAQQVVNSGDYTSDYVYVKGIITSLQSGNYTFSADYGNYTYCINDTKTTTNQFTVFRGKNLGNTNFTSADDLAVGDTVIVYGPLTSYNNSPQLDQGNYLYSLNGTVVDTGSDAEPSGSGTATDPYNAVAATNAAEALSSTETLEGVYVTGKVSRISEISTSYGNATYYISEDGSTSNEFEIYRGYYLDGEKFTSEDQLEVGDSVVVMGDIVNYNGKYPKMTQGSQIVSINGSGSTTTTGLTATFADGQDNFTINDITLGDGATYVWAHNDNGYMKASAYVKRTNIACQSQLISPAFSLAGLSSATLSFQHTGKFFSSMSDEIKVLASTDATNWTELTISAYPSGSDWTFVDATCDLSQFAGQSTVYIAFQYTSTSDSAPTWEIKNVVVK